MPPVTYRAHALGPLRNVDWTVPEGVSLVVGPNRVGKSTLLKLPEFLRIAVKDGLDEAVREVFRGSAFLRNFTVAPDEKISVGLALAELAWKVELIPEEGSVSQFAPEMVSLADEILASRSSGSETIELDGQNVRIGSQLIPKFLLWKDPKDEPKVPTSLLVGSILGAFAGLSAAYRTYEYQISHLLRFGSQQSSAKRLMSSGENVFPLLRNWRDRSEDEARYEFVLETLREAFPHVHRLDFESAGQTVTANIIDRRWKAKTPISHESTGLITAMLQLCAVASAKNKFTVTLDELETSLHPHAIRVLIAAFRRWAKEHELRIVLATQSETVLDQFRDEPEKIFVLEARQDVSMKHEVSPRPLTELFDAEWLSQFSLGDLFSHLEFGAPDKLPG